MHFYWRSDHRVTRADAAFVCAVCAPAADAAGNTKRAGRLFAGTDRKHLIAKRSQINARAERCTGGVAAQLARNVITPTAHATGRTFERARMDVARRRGRDSERRVWHPDG